MLAFKRFRKRLAIVVGFSLILAGFAQAAPADVTVWANLRELNPGQKVHVVQKDQTAWTGSFVVFSDESISLKTSAGDKVIARAELSQVSRHGGKRVGHGLLGAAIGGAAGAGVGAASGGCDNHSFGPCFGRGFAGAVLGAFGAVTGFLVGVAIPGNTVIYRTLVR